MNNLEMYSLMKARNGGGSSETEATLKAVIDRSIARITFPSGLTKIGAYAFYRCTNLTDIRIPSSVMSVEHNSFRECSGLNRVTISNGVVQLGTSAFNGCSNLTILSIPNSVTAIDSLTVFRDCVNLRKVHLEEGFNAKNLDLSSSTLLGGTTLEDMLNALADRTGQTVYTLTIGSTNLAKLSNEQIAIATQKNWTLA